jgi:hypothetical protein
MHKVSVADRLTVHYLEKHVTNPLDKRAHDNLGALRAFSLWKAQSCLVRQGEPQLPGRSRARLRHSVPKANNAWRVRANQSFVSRIEAAPIDFDLSATRVVQSSKDWNGQVRWPAIARAQCLIPQLSNTCDAALTYECVKRSGWPMGARWGCEGRLSVVE